MCKSVVAKLCCTFMLLFSQLRSLNIFKLGSTFNGPSMSFQLELHTMHAED